MILAWLNRPEDAIAAAKEAIHLSPYDPDRFVFWIVLAWAHLAAGEHEEALLWADHALRENTGAPALRLKLSLCGHLGRHDDAKACLRRLREVHSEPTVAAAKRALGQGKSADVVARLTEGLRKAGPPAQWVSVLAVIGATSPLARASAKDQYPPDQVIVAPGGDRLYGAHTPAVEMSRRTDQIDRGRGETRHATWAVRRHPLGFDRLVMLCTGASRTEDVL